MSSIRRHIPVAVVFVALVLLPAGTAMAGVNQKVKKLKQQVNGLQQQVDALEREPGPQGAQGQPGEQGPQGEQGLPGPSTGPAGGDLTGTFPNPLIANGAVGSSAILDGQVGTADQAVVPAARVGSGDNDAEVADNTFEPINFEQESDATHFDTANVHSTTTNADRLTAPVSGLYYVHGHIAWGAGSDNDLNTLALEIVDDQGRRLSRDLNEGPFAPGGSLHSQEVSTTVALSAGEFVQLHGFQEQGDNDALGWNTSDDFSPIFEMSWLGPAP